MKVLICFGGDWGRHPSTFQFLAQHLAKKYKILWIDSLGLRRPRLGLADTKRAWGKLRQWWGGSVRKSGMPDNLTVYTPVVLPLHKYGWVRDVNRTIIRRAISKLLMKLDEPTVCAPIVVTSCPSTGYLVGHLGEAHSVYYCADEHAEFPGMDRGLVRQLETQLLNQVDAVVVTSETLLRTKAVAGKSIKLLRHGVDCEHFAQEFDQIPIAECLRSIPRPIFGYHGLMQAIIDFDLIAAVAKRRPDWSFVFVGSRYGDLNQFPDEPNIHYFDGQPYEDIPSFIRGFDVGVIPYRLDERTRNCNPVKLREYLAAGKPVLSTPLPEVLMYADLVSIAETPDEFIKKGEQLLQETGPDYRRQRRQRMKAESWDVVAQQFAQVLESLPRHGDA